LCLDNFFFLLLLVLLFDLHQCHPVSGCC
jgi:hypothetical protein